MPSTLKNRHSWIPYISDKYFRATHFHASVFYSSGGLPLFASMQLYVGASSQSGQQKYPLQPPCQGEIDQTSAYKILLTSYL